MTLAEPPAPHSNFAWDVQEPFVERLIVQPADVDRFGHTNNVIYLHWLERVAWAHSAHLGVNFEVYEQLNCGCVARRHELDYLLPTYLGDELLVGTWIMDNDGRVSMWRGYQIVRAGDGAVVLRGRTRWVCVDMRSGRPRRQPPEFVAIYRPATPQVLPESASSSRR
jgi:acyl-CoA thioester hydrolase